MTTYVLTSSQHTSLSKSKQIELEVDIIDKIFLETKIVDFLYNLLIRTKNTFMLILNATNIFNFDLTLWTTGVRS